jgi:hypothetical protein
MQIAIPMNFASATLNERQVLFEKIIKVAATALDIGLPGDLNNPVPTRRAFPDLSIILPSSVSKSRRLIFDFLKLPGETRNMIYRACLPDYFSRQKPGFHRTSPLGLLLANKQIHHEFHDLVYEYTPYRLLFRPCPPACSCGEGRNPVSSFADFDINDMLVEYRGSAPIVPHFHFPVKLAREHLAAFRRFNHLEVDWALGSAVRHTGVKQIDLIVKSIGPTFLEAIRLQARPLKVTIRWGYMSRGPSGHAIKKDKAGHLARLDHWTKAINRVQELKVEVLNKDLIRDGDFYKLIAVLELSDAALERD